MYGEDYLPMGANNSIVHATQIHQECADSGFNQHCSDCMAFFDLIKQGKLSKADSVDYKVFGRIERCVINDEGVKEAPLQLSYRPHRQPHAMHPPSSFVASSEALSRLITCDSLQQVLEAISLELDVIQSRLNAVKKGKLDHMIILFSPDDVPVELADLDGMLRLLEILHGATAQRFRKMIPLFKAHYVGPDKFQNRLDIFVDKEWNNIKMIRDCLWLPSDIHLTYPACGCQYYDFDVFCTEFDKHFPDSVETMTDDISEDNLNRNISALRETRKMMFVMFGCNRWYGMDGHIYDFHGKQMDKEYIAINQTLDARNNDGKQIFYTKFLSEVPRFAEVS